MTRLIFILGFVGILTAGHGFAAHQGEVFQVKRLRGTVAVDRDGDRTADIVLTQNACDGAGPVPGGSCIDEWARVKVG